MISSFMAAAKEPTPSSLSVRAAFTWSKTCRSYLPQKYASLSWTNSKRNLIPLPERSKLFFITLQGPSAIAGESNFSDCAHLIISVPLQRAQNTRKHRLIVPGLSDFILAFTAHLAPLLRMIEKPTQLGFDRVGIIGIASTAIARLDEG